jgi:trans-2,3-dihydro-3-hydroxyanthranilate isomerase
MQRQAKFTLVDVFTSRPFGGNQLAVFTDAAGLSDAEMQELAHEMNFSESTFVIPADSAGAARRVRIFTPKHEMPMAGHPTVGTTWVLASHGQILLKSGRVVTDATLELGIGPVTVSIESVDAKPEFVWMTHREAEFGATRGDRERIAQALGITASDIHDDLPIQIVSTGFPFMFVPVRTLDALARCAPNASALAALFEPGEPVLATYMFAANESGEFAPRSRMFAPHDGVSEDPATGGAAGPFGAYAAKYGLIKPAPSASFVIQQGVEMGRPSEIHVEVARKDSGAPRIRIGGRCAIVGEGAMFL